MKVLVTGASGFVGRAVCKAISSRHADWQIYNLDLEPEEYDGVRAYKADVTVSASVQNVLRNCSPDVVVHTAGVVPNGQSRYSNDAKVRASVFKVNVEGTRNMLAASKAIGVKAFVHTSSCTVISDDLDHDYPLMNETLPTGHATLAYGASKAEAEKLVLAANCPEMATCALRLATVIGPGDNYGVLDTIFRLVENYQTPFIIGGGNNMYDFVYIDNIALAHALAVENLLQTRTAAGLAMFISNQEPIYFRDFMLAIFAQCGGHTPPFQVVIPSAMAKWLGWAAEWYSWASGKEAALSRGSVMDAVGTRYSTNDRAIQILGYRPIIKFSEGFKRTCADFRRRRQMKVTNGKTA